MGGPEKDFLIFLLLSTLSPSRGHKQGESGGAFQPLDSDLVIPTQVLWAPSLLALSVPFQLVPRMSFFKCPHPVYW